MLNIFSDLWNMLYQWDSDLACMLVSVLGAVVLFVVGGLIVHWAFGFAGKKKEEKARSEKLFETTAYFNALGRSLPRKLR